MIKILKISWIEQKSKLGFNNTTVQKYKQQILKQIGHIAP